MKKKLVSVLLCATMIATMVAGCGSSGGTQKDDSSSKTKTEDTKKSDDTTTAHRIPIWKGACAGR